MEQTVLNVVFENDIYILNPRFNVYTMMSYLSFKELSKFRKFNMYYSETEYNEARNNPCLLHMTSSSILINRPWIEKNNYPTKNVFLKYVELTPWANNALDKDKRRAKKKIIDFIISHLPRSLMLCFFSFVYNGPRISSIKRKMKRESKK